MEQPQFLPWNVGPSEDIFGNDSEHPASCDDLIDLQELEDYMKKCELLRRQELERRAERDARRTPEQQEFLRNAREHIDNMEILRDIIIVDKRRIFPRYTEKDLIKKVIEMGPYAFEPEVADLFRPDETGMLTFENIQRASDMLGPYACKVDRQFPGQGIGVAVHPHENLFLNLPEIIETVEEALREMENDMDEEQE